LVDNGGLLRLCFLQAAADGQEGVVKALLTSPRSGGPGVNINARDSPGASFIAPRTQQVMCNHAMWMKNDDDVPGAYATQYPSALEYAAFNGCEIASWVGSGGGSFISTCAVDHLWSSYWKHGAGEFAWCCCVVFG